MLTVDIKINGVTVQHIYAHNTNGEEESTYGVAVADTVPIGEAEPSIITFETLHKRSLGISSLVRHILEELDARN